MAGYLSLSQKEKNLFFKALGRRDILDISRKDYKKSFFGMAERNFVNQADRDKLIDTFIDSSLEDGVGIVLAPGDRYEAMRSLFSTQISDREKFDSEKELGKMMAVERNLFMSRGAVGDETANKLLDIEKDYYGIKEAVGEQIQAAVDGINYAKKCVEHVTNMAKAIAEKHRGMSGLAGDIVSDARGYEHTSELIEHTGMSLAQSLCFCASRFNPMVQTRIMAIAVMSVMGLTEEIGSTSPETVEKLFNSFKMKR